MTATEIPHRTLWVSVVLGLVAAICNVVITVSTNDRTLDFAPGHLFALLPALAFGFRGALISAGIPALAVALVTGDATSSLRTLGLCLSIGMLTQNRRKVPPFLVVALVWALIFVPAYWIVRHELVRDIWALINALLAPAMLEVFLAIVGTTILMSSHVWGWFGLRPRHIQSQDVITHALAAVSVLPLLLLASANHRASLAANAPIGADSVTGPILFVVVVVLPVVAGHFLALALEDHNTGLQRTSLIPSASHAGSFSGRSAEFWRRRSSSDDLMSSASSTRDRTAAMSSTSANTADFFGGPNALPADAGILALTKEGAIAFLNRKFREMAEIRGAEAVGRQVSALDLPPELRENILRLVKSGSPRGSRTLEFKRVMGGKNRFFQLTASKSGDVTSATIGDLTDGLILALKDITERRTIESHLLQAQKLDSLGRIVTQLGHAFNNALTVILGKSSIALGNDSPAKMKQGLVEVISTAQQAGALTRQLLDYAESGPSTSQTEDLCKLLQGRLALLKELVGEQVIIDFSLPKNPVLINCDAHLLFQAISNLILNAKEALPTGSGTIQFSVETEEFDDGISDVHLGAHGGTYARIRIRDEGTGMSADVLARAFEPLFTTKNLRGHAGLGLSIVYSIVRAHDGFLTLESKPDRGTTVSLYIPVLTASQVIVPPPPPSTIALAEPVAGSGTHKILVVEDESALKDLIVLMLKSLGYTVESCDNGEEALVLWKTGQFSIVLADMIMPRMDGRELIKKLEALGKPFRVILMTGYGTNGAIPAGVEVLPKPFAFDDLARAVKRHAGVSPLPPPIRDN